MLTKLVDYDYYFYKYGGSSIPAPSFGGMSIRASVYINRYTYNRVNNDNLNDMVRNATCEIAELLYSQDRKKENIENNKIIASETVGSHSKNYVNNLSLIDKQILTEKELESACYRICYKHLATTGLMYRGI